MKTGAGDENKSSEGAFGKLVGELEVLRKATASDDDAGIAAAAKAGGADGAAGDAGAGTGAGAGADGSATVEDEDEDEDDKGDGMTKALALFDDHGNPVEAVDGTEMVKAMQVELGEIKAARAQENEHLGKALTSVHDMLKSQGDLIKSQADNMASMTEQLAKLSGSGRGARSVTVAPVAGEPLAKSQDGALTDGEVMAKAESTFQLGTGVIRGSDLAYAETCMNRGLPIPADVRARLSV